MFWQLIHFISQLFFRLIEMILVRYVYHILKC